MCTSHTAHRVQCADIHSDIGAPVWWRVYVSVGACHVQLSQLEDEPWYFGALSRDAMSAILKESPVGSFGVRVSSQPGCFVLTFQQDNKHTPQAKRLQSILIQPCKTVHDIVLS